MSDEWYWSLTEKRAVPAAERGHPRDVLGPYPTKEAAENWQATVEARNEQWDEDEREWEGDEDGD